MREQGGKIAGVMGGMGPDATVDFMARVIALTDAERDQDHVHMIVDQDPTVPNRQHAIAGGEDTVSPALLAMAQRLEAAGADFLVMVCNTAHVFLDGVRGGTRIPFVSIVDESVQAVLERSPDARKVGIMATDGCLDTDIYQAAIRAAGLAVVEPHAADKTETMRLINLIKAGDQGEAVRQGMRQQAEALLAAGADAIIAGCTEIPLVFEGDDFPVPVISSTAVLAERTIKLAKGDVPLPARQD